MSMTVSQALQRAARLLAESSDTARFDADLLLSFACGRNRTTLYTWPDYELSAAEQSQFESLLRRRQQGEPVAYLTGVRAFWTLELRVNPAVLIPRPETELLVELALNLAPETGQWVADLGTGSGAVALALASERPDWRITATDRSEQALQLAKENCQALGLENVEFAAGSWCDALPARKRYQLIVSNPPYIDPQDPHLRQGDLRFEPVSALVAQQHGLADIVEICTQAGEHLQAEGMLLLEHGSEQGPQVRSIMAHQGFSHVQTHRDLAGLDRITLGRHASGDR